MKAIKTTLWALDFLLVAWVILSIAEIMLKNTASPDYSVFNLIKLMMGWIGK